MIPRGHTQRRLVERTRLIVPGPDRVLGDDVANRRVFQSGCVVESHPVDLRQLDNVVFNEAGELFLPEGIASDWFASQKAHDNHDRARFTRKHERAKVKLRPFHCDAHVDSGSVSAAGVPQAPPLWITDRYSHVYHHWMTHALVRLEAAVAAGFSGGLLLPHWISQLPFVRQSLQAYGGIRPQFAETGNWAADSVLLVTRCAVPPDIHPVLVRNVARRLKRYFAPDPPQRERRVYVTRRLARNRHMANEAELAGVLSRHGFEIVEMERMDLEQQIRLMSATKVLAGPHGAGLTNTMFMDEGATLLELRQAEGPPLSFMKLAGIVGQRYGYCVCENAEPGMHHHGAHVQLEPGKLDEVLSKL